MQCGRIFSGRLWLKQGCFANNDDENYDGNDDDDNDDEDVWGCGVTVLQLLTSAPDGGLHMGKQPPVSTV
jgi:hypothetical protein